ncbi:unnamed protein product, partial [Meganyctiphanes norvegica]
FLINLRSLRRKKPILDSSAVAVASTSEDKQPDDAINFENMSDTTSVSTVGSQMSLSSRPSAMPHGRNAKKLTNEEIRELKRLIKESKKLHGGSISPGWILSQWTLTELTADQLKSKLKYLNKKLKKEGETL